MNKNGSTTMGGEGGNLESIKERAKGFMDQGQEKVEQLKTRVMDATDKAKQRGGVYIDKTTDIIKAHPLKAVGVAFGIGYIGMRLFRR